VVTSFLVTHVNVQFFSGFIGSIFLVDIGYGNQFFYHFDDEVFGGFRGQSLLKTDRPTNLPTY